MAEAIIADHCSSKRGAVILAPAGSGKTHYCAGPNVPKRVIDMDRVYAVCDVFTGGVNTKLAEELNDMAREAGCIALTSTWHDMGHIDAVVLIDEEANERYLKAKRGAAAYAFDYWDTSLVPQRQLILKWAGICGVPCFDTVEAAVGFAMAPRYYV